MTERTDRSVWSERRDRGPSHDLVAVVPVRGGVVPAGALEAVAECGGRAVVAGSAPGDADLEGTATDVRLVELGGYAPAAWAAALAPILEDADVVVLPGSPDGRDLAPRLAHVLGRALLAGAIEVTRSHARLARGGGLVLHDVAITAPVVATLQPGVRGVVADPSPPAPTDVDVDVVSQPTVAAGRDAEVVDVLPPDVATMDLAEADRIVGGGAGLDGPERFAHLATIAASLGAAMGVTRVITDRGWAEHQRQIGTTGVVVDPALYLAFGVSGAVQHTAGLGAPEHIVSVNVDPHCPMMQLADLAIVADANDVVDALAARLAAVPAGAASGRSSTAP